MQAHFSVRGMRSRWKNMFGAKKRTVCEDRPEKLRQFGLIGPEEIAYMTASLQFSSDDLMRPRN